MELDDGDFLDLDEWNVNADRTVILSHGLEGSSQDPYVAGMAALMAGQKWNVIAWNYRGCSGSPNRLSRSYHSGDTPDLQAVIARARQSVDRIALVGFSLGGNLTLKLVGSGIQDDSVLAAVAISAPVDLESSARKLDRNPANRIYLSRLIRRLESKIRNKALQFPAEIDVTRLKGVRGFSEFDDRFTAPMHGFRDAGEYWTRSSARQFLPQITIPSLLINAEDDPFLAPPCYPFPEAECSKAFHFEAPTHGGHLGFIDRLSAKFPWAERRTAEFLDLHVPANAH